MPSSASCCGTGYCDAGNYCDGDGCCEDGKTCYTPTTFISLGPESTATTSTSPRTTTTTNPAASSSVVVVPVETETGILLSTGAKAGIGVGVGVGGLAIIVGIGFWAIMARKRKQRDNGEPRPYPPYQPHQQYEAYKPPAVSPDVPGKSELDSTGASPIRSTTSMSDMGLSAVRPMSDATFVSTFSPINTDRSATSPYEPVPYELDDTSSPRSELLGVPVDQTFQSTRRGV